VALAAQGVLDDMGLTGWPKTSGSRAFTYTAYLPAHGDDGTLSGVRRAAVAIPATRRSSGGRPRSRDPQWWKEERHGVLPPRLQPYAKDPQHRLGLFGPANARLPARLPLLLYDFARLRARVFTLATVPARLFFSAIRDPGAGIDAEGCGLRSPFSLAARQEAAGPDATWPP